MQLLFEGRELASNGKETNKFAEFLVSMIHSNNIVKEPWLFQDSLQYWTCNVFDAGTRLKGLLQY